MLFLFRDEVALVHVFLPFLPMELRSGRRLRHSSPPPPPPHGTRSHPMDLISALPDEMLLLVLARLRCVRTAVQTSLLSRRWRGLWIGLTDLTFRGLAPTTIEAAFCRLLAASPQVSTLDIGITMIQAAPGTDSLLRAAVRLSPRQLVFTLQESYTGYITDIELPCFQCTTSIELDMRLFGVKLVPAGEFTALENLSITGKIINLGCLLNRCPRLRVLSVSYPDMYLVRKTLPPVGEFPVLEKLSLSGKIVDPGPLLNNCQRLRELSVTQSDTRALHITVPPSGEFPVLEKLSLSGKIADLGTLLNRCPRLRVLGVTFTKMALGSLEAALTALDEAAPLGLVLSVLGIDIPWRDDGDAARFASLLGTVARLSPQELVMTDNFERCNTYHNQINADLPCFPHTTSIQMRLQSVCFARLPAGEFSVLENLSLSGRCNIVEIGTLVTRCPRLRVLKVTVATGKITVHSSSLQKLDVSHRDSHKECHGIDIVAPMLKQLHLDIHASRDMDVSILAPALEKVLWERSYAAASLVFGSWRLMSMRVQTIERRYVQKTCPQVLCLRMYAGNHLDADLNFAKEIEKLPVTDFLVLELNFRSYCWHVYGALVLQLLGMHRIRAATKKLKVHLPWFPEAKRECVRNCPCDNPKNWRSQSILCTSLEEVEIYGYNGEDHEHDFLRLIFKCSPMLKSVIVRPSHSFRSCPTELSKICSAHPSVKCYR